MRRMVLATVTVVLAVLMVPALASSGARSVSASYTGPVLSAAHFITGAHENAVTVRIDDRSGRTVAAQLDYTTRDGQSATAVICGETTAPVPVATGSALTVTPGLSGCPGGLLALPTIGTITVDFTAGAPATARAAAPARASVVPPSDRWALVIGVSRYDAPTHPTYGGTGDAAVVRAALLQAGWLPDHIRSLVDSAATASAIRDAMSWLAAHSGPTTFSFFHYSGHVKQRAGHEYLWPVDNDLIVDDDIAAALQQVRGRAWLDFAGCESAGFDEGLASPLRIVSTSSQVNEKSYEVPSWHQSVWGGLVFDQGLRQGRADTNGDHQVSIGEALAYGSRYAPQMTAQQSKGAQHPHIAGGNGAWSLSAPPA